MSRRGFTLLETVLSIGLLGALFVVSGRWLQVVASARADVEGPRRWEEAASALLARIHDDLWTGDVVGGKGEPPVAVEDGTLRLHTRKGGRRGGRVTHAYRFDPLAARIVRADLSGEAIPLVEGVSAFEVEWKDRILTVRIESSEGRERRRRFVLP